MRLAVCEDIERAEHVIDRNDCFEETIVLKIACNAFFPQKKLKEKVKAKATAAAKSAASRVLSKKKDSKTKDSETRGATPDTVSIQIDKETDKEGAKKTPADAAKAEAAEAATNAEGKGVQEGEEAKDEQGGEEPAEAEGAEEKKKKASLAERAQEAATKKMNAKVQEVRRQSVAKAKMVLKKVDGKAKGAVVSSIKYLDGDDLRPVNTD